MYYIPINNIEDKLISKFTPNGDFSVKTTTWAFNTLLKPYIKPNLLIACGN